MTVKLAPLGLRRYEQLFRDGALAPLQPPQSDFCLFNMALYELDLDPAGLLPPLKLRI